MLIEQLNIDVKVTNVRVYKKNVAPTQHKTKTNLNA
jgi:hypothetical protein